MRTRFLPLLLGVFAPWCEAQTQKPETFLRPNDVIALVGGEDMVAADEYGYLEFLLQWALPRHQIKVRSIAWEGDTVFQQPRMLNYPTLEQQLDQIGATVVCVQLGRIENPAAGKEGFADAWRKLFDRLGIRAGGEGRRALLILPTPAEGNATQLAAVQAAGDQISEIARERSCRVCSLSGTFREVGARGFLRDGVHLNDLGHRLAARTVLRALSAPEVKQQLDPSDLAWMESPILKFKLQQDLLDQIRAKNRLWNNYRRPQNWAFLAGDRTEQPSSRDHIDRNKRWFPEEMKQWLPLIDAKEREIWNSASKLPR